MKETCFSLALLIQMNILLQMHKKDIIYGRVYEHFIRKNLLKKEHNFIQHHPQRCHYVVLNVTKENYSSKFIHLIPKTEIKIRL